MHLSSDQWQGSHFAYRFDLLEDDAIKKTSRFDESVEGPTRFLSEGKGSVGGSS
jgi:hypothetical protein